MPPNKITTCRKCNQELEEKAIWLYCLDVVGCTIRLNDLKKPRDIIAYIELRLVPSFIVTEDPRWQREPERKWLEDYYKTSALRLADSIRSHPVENVKVKIVLASFPFLEPIGITLDYNL